jgi:hypothetical protein
MDETAGMLVCNFSKALTRTAQAGCPKPQEIGRREPLE